MILINSQLAVDVLVEATSSYQKYQEDRFCLLIRSPDFPKFTVLKNI